MKIKINLIKYNQREYEVQQTTTIFQVKKMFEDDVGIPMQNFELYFEGQTLQSNKTVGFYNIPDNSILQIKGNLIASLKPRLVPRGRMDALLSELASL